MVQIERIRYSDVHNATNVCLICNPVGERLDRLKNGSELGTYIAFQFWQIQTYRGMPDTLCFEVLSFTKRLIKKRKHVRDPISIFHSFRLCVVDGKYLRKLYGDWRVLVQIM